MILNLVRAVDLSYIEVHRDPGSSSPVFDSEESPTIQQQLNGNGKEQKIEEGQPQVIFSSAIDDPEAENVPEKLWDDSSVSSHASARIIRREFSRSNESDILPSYNPLGGGQLEFSGESSETDDSSVGGSASMNQAPQVPLEFQQKPVESSKGQIPRPAFVTAPAPMPMSSPAPVQQQQEQQQSVIRRRPDNIVYGVPASVRTFRPLSSTPSANKLPAPPAQPTSALLQDIDSDLLNAYDPVVYRAAPTPAAPSTAIPAENKVKHYRSSRRRSRRNGALGTDAASESDGGLSDLSRSSQDSSSQSQRRPRTPVDTRNNLQKNIDSILQSKKLQQQPPDARPSKEAESPVTVQHSTQAALADLSNLSFVSAPSFETPVGVDLSPIMPLNDATISQTNSISPQFYDISGAESDSVVEDYGGAESDWYEPSDNESVYTNM